MVCYASLFRQVVDLFSRREFYQTAIKLINIEKTFSLTETFSSQIPHSL